MKTVNRRARIAQGLQRQATTAAFLPSPPSRSSRRSLRSRCYSAPPSPTPLGDEPKLAIGLAGVPRSTVIRSHVAAVAARLTLAAAVGFGCGLATLHLSLHLIPRAAPGSVPPPLLSLAWFPAFAAVAITTIPVLLAEIGIAARTTKRADAALLRSATS